MASKLFEGVGKDVGIRIWRVNSFQLVDQPKNSYGSFFSGDCYLILDTFLADKAIRHHIHFWLGKDCSQDEAGSVAIFAAQLDELLGGGPVQFRQPQGSESPEFLRLFPRLKYMEGGFASGFRDASSRAAPGPVRLYQIKSPNRTCVQVFEVPCALASLNHGDCFLLEDPAARQLWVWHGSGANIREKMKAVDSGNAFKEGTGIKLAVLDDGDAVSGEACAFFERLGCDRPPEAAAIRDAAADAPPAPLLQPPRLYKVAGGGASFQPVAPADGDAAGPLTAALLQPGGQYVLHAGGCVWVWTGASAGAEAGAPLQVGSRFLAEQSLAPSTLVRAVKARFEPGLFTTYFADWGAEARAGGGGGATPGKDSFGNVIPGPGKGTDDQPYNADEAAAAMVALAAAAVEAEAAGGAAAGRGGGLDAAYANLGSSKVEVWALIGASSLELPKQEKGTFYDGAAYVVLHTYSTAADGSSPRYAVYCWQGRHAPALEAGAAAVLATDLHRGRHAGRSTLVRVERGAEPGHLVRLFRGAMVVRRGPRPAHVAPGRSPPGTHLYQVKGEAVQAAHAVEVEPAAASLAGGDCFLLERVGAIGSGEAVAVSLWLGGGSSEQEREVAAAAAGVLAGGGEVERIEEGAEPDAFWEALGGRAEYPTGGGTRGGARPPLLFHLRDCAGRGLKVECAATFTQGDLAGDDVMLLDTGRELYVWYGGSCKPAERPRARDVAGRYLAAAGRAGGGGALVEMEAGQEPPFFTCHFPGWDARPVAHIPDVYADKVARLSIQKEQEREGQE